MNVGKFVFFVYLILVIWVAHNIWDFLMLSLISSFIITQSVKWLVPCSLLYYFLQNTRIKYLSSRGSTQTMVGICPLNACQWCQLSRWWGSWNYSKRTTGSKSCIYMLVWILVSPLINSIISSQKYSLVIELVNIVVILCINQLTHGNVGIIVQYLHLTDNSPSVPWSNYYNI